MLSHDRGYALRDHRSRQREVSSARTVVVVTRTVVTTKRPRFTNAQFAGKHFVCGFCDGDSQAALSEYKHRYPDRRHPYRRVFKTMQRNLREAGSPIPPPRVGRGRRYVRGGEDVLDILHDSP
jgi:hypothetical protein